MVESMLRVDDSELEDDGFLFSWAKGWPATGISVVLRKNSRSNNKLKCYYAKGRDEKELSFVKCLKLYRLVVANLGMLEEVNKNLQNDTETMEGVFSYGMVVKNKKVKMQINGLNVSSRDRTLMVDFNDKLEKILGVKD